MTILYIIKLIQRDIGLNFNTSKLILDLLQVFQGIYGDQVAHLKCPLVIQFKININLSA